MPAMLRGFELILTLLQLAPIVVLSIRSRPVMSRLAHRAVASPTPRAGDRIDFLRSSSSHRIREVHK